MPRFPPPPLDPLVGGPLCPSPLLPPPPPRKSPTVEVRTSERLNQGEGKAPLKACLGCWGLARIPNSLESSVRVHPLFVPVEEPPPVEIHRRKGVNPGGGKDPLKVWWCPGDGGSWP